MPSSVPSRDEAAPLKTTSTLPHGGTGEAQPKSIFVDRRK